MASAAVMNAVAAKLASVWTATPVVYPNTSGSVPNDGSAFLVVEYPIANETMKSFGAPGSNIWREEGAFRFILCVPIGQGLDAAQDLTQTPAIYPWATLMDALRASFRGQTFSGVTCWEADASEFNDQSDRGSFCELYAIVHYWLDVIG
jgi:hypothetical protein